VNKKMNEFDYSKLKRCGQDVRIADYVIIKYPELVSIGSHVAIDNYCYISTALEIGNYIHIGPLCSIIGGKESLCFMRDYSGLSAGCRIICSSDDYLGSGLTNPTIPSRYRAKVKISNVVFEKHALLGTNCVVHPGITIGEGAVVGSCSLVTKNLEPWNVYLGIPAKLIKPRERKRILELEEHLRKEIQ
jgi:acetyltransferase-like isoleucine patch superfamily enzyme